MLKIVTLFTVLIFNPLSAAKSVISEKIMIKAEKKVKKQLKQVCEFEFFDPEITTENADNSNFYYLKTLQNEFIGIAVISYANGCLIGGCSIDNRNQNRYEKFYMLSVYNLQKELVLVNILDYPGEHGYEISTKWWLKQFLGSVEKKHQYRQNIDALSGATVSSQTVVNEINTINSIIKRMDIN